VRETDETALALPPEHSVSGNPMRFRTGPVAVATDEEWRSAMKTHDRRLVTWLSAPLLKAYGYI
jgi:hypothetical protein